MKNKKLFGFLSAMLFICIAHGQIVNKPNNTFGTEFNRGQFDSTIYYPTGCGVPTDTTSLRSYGFSGAGQKIKMSALYYDSCGHNLYTYDPSTKTWPLVGGNVAASDSVYQRNDSVFYKKNATEHFSGIVLFPIQLASDKRPGDIFILNSDTASATTTHPTDQACNNINNISLSYIGGTNYAFNAGTYRINCIDYSIPVSGTIGVPSGTLLPGHFRTDAVVLNGGTVPVLLTGDSSVNGLALLPPWDPATQILLGYVRIDSNATVPTGVSSVTVYYDNKVGEWTHATFGGATVAYNYHTVTLAPGDSSIHYTLLPTNSGSRFTAPAVQSSAGKKLSFFIRHDATVNAARNWVIRKMLAGVQVSGSNAVTLTTNNGYNKTAAFNNLWQLVTLDIGIAFGGQDNFDGWEFRNTGTGGTVNQYIDSIKVESGIIVVPSPSVQNAATTYTANQNAAYVTQPNDNISILGAKNIYTRGDGLKTITIEDGVNATDNNNFKKDSVILYTPPDYTHTFSAAGWTKAANFNTFATETVVSGGIQIASSHTGVGTDWIYAPWTSMADNTTIEMTFTLNTIGLSNPIVGMVRNALGGTTVGGVVYMALNEINVNGSTHSINHFNAGDLIRMRMSMDYTTFTVDVYNITQNKFDTYSIAGANYVFASASLPGIYVTNATITVKDFRYYARNYKPDLMIVGDSKILQAGGSSSFASYDSTLSGRLQTRTNQTVSSFSKASVTLQQFLLCVPELRKLKPAKVLLDIGTVNIFVTDPQSTWGPLYINAVDSILNIGVKLILAKDFPSSTIETAPLGHFIDSVYANDTSVSIIDLYSTTPLYSSGDTYHHNSAYYESDIYGHPNEAGAHALADYIVPLVQGFGRYRSAGGGGGGGSSTFTGLTDAFASYTGLANQAVVVNGGETGLTTQALTATFRNSATLNFGSTAASSSSDLTITVTGASVGDPVALGLPGTIDANSTYTAWVSATNTVTVRFNNYQSVGAIDPASGTFKVIVYKY